MSIRHSQECSLRGTTLLTDCYSLIETRTLHRRVLLKDRVKINKKKSLRLLPGGCKMSSCTPGALCYVKFTKEVIVPT